MKRTSSQMYSNNLHAAIQKRPFKRVRVHKGQIVPYGTTRWVNPATRGFGGTGVKNVKKGCDQILSNPYIEWQMDDNQNIELLNWLGPGTGSWNRVGRYINMSSIRLRMKFTCTWDISPFTSSGNPAVATPPTILDSANFRYLIVYDKQPNGVLPSKAEILRYQLADGSEAGIWDGMLAYDNMERFVILKDETMTVQVPPLQQIFQYDTTVDPPKIIQAVYPKMTRERHVDVYLKLNLKTNFKSESQLRNIADLSTGALYLVLIKEPNIVQNSVAISPQVTMQGIARLRFTDQ